MLWRRVKIPKFLYPSSMLCSGVKHNQNTRKLIQKNMERKILSKPQEILHFWFGDPNDDQIYGKEKRFWWSSTPSLDEEIRTLFGEDYEKARRGEYEDWKEDEYSTLALILLLDQIPRNIFRGYPQTYDTDCLALETSKMAIKKGYDAKLRLACEKKFMYLPFAHSENLEDQATCLTLLKPLNNAYWYRYSESYYRTIEKFGRFPHRNAILGRESTPEEINYIGN